ncbi:unnamed protein product [Mytilus coruscus]|uniref:C1q domain-containing protein n=1 Tax=Mytilus coruscus TaxID=42192 RepID=A0A6J8A0L0_MYTCO|nr:unnamed protein product [Mytilus coruscus]
MIKQVHVLTAVVLQVTKPLFSISGNAVVFSALLSHNLVNVPNGQVIIFDKTSVNVGNGYVTQTGIFRAPVAGVYQFTLTIGGHVVNTHANILHNGNIIGHLYADPFRDGQYDRATLTLALYLDIGDEVWTVDPDGQNNQVIIGSNAGMPVSIFTGHLIVANKEISKRNKMCVLFYL